MSSWVLIISRIGTSQPPQVSFFTVRLVERWNRFLLRSNRISCISIWASYLFFCHWTPVEKSSPSLLYLPFKYLYTLMRSYSFSKPSIPSSCSYFPRMLCCHLEGHQQSGGSAAPPSLVAPANLSRLHSAPSRGHQ